MSVPESAPAGGPPPCHTCPCFVIDEPVVTFGGDTIARGNGFCHLNPKVEAKGATSWCAQHPRFAGWAAPAAGQTSTVAVGPLLGGTPPKGTTAGTRS